MFSDPIGKPGLPRVCDIVHYDEEGQILKTVTVDGVAQEFRRLRNSMGRCETHGWFSSLKWLGRGWRKGKKGLEGVPAKNQRPHPPSAARPAREAEANAEADVLLAAAHGHHVRLGRRGRRCWPCLRGTPSRAFASIMWRRSTRMFSNPSPNDC